MSRPQRQAAIKAKNITAQWFQSSSPSSSSSSPTPDPLPAASAISAPPEPDDEDILFSNTNRAPNRPRDAAAINYSSSDSDAAEELKTLIKENPDLKRAAIRYRKRVSRAAKRLQPNELEDFRERLDRHLMRLARNIRDGVESDGLISPVEDDDWIDRTQDPDADALKQEALDIIKAMTQAVSARAHSLVASERDDEEESESIGDDEGDDDDEDEGEDEA